MMRTRCLRRLRVGLAVVLAGTLAGFGGAHETRAEVLVVPNALATQEGNSNNGSPFSFASRYQQVYGASEFLPLSEPVLITALSFRPDATYGGTFSVTIPDIQVSLSTTLAAPDGLDPVFANNIGSNNQLVFSGSLSLSSAFTGPAAGPKDFDVTITLQTPFLYDPGLATFCWI